jgi:predicted N-acetyltransferase YhbS
MVEMGIKFLHGTPYQSFVGENREQMAECCKSLISSGGLLVAEYEGRLVGMIGFVVVSHFLSGEKVCGEMFWWVEPEYRRGLGIRLMRAAENAAKLGGAKHMLMIAPNPEVASMYERMNYQFVETAYQRAL